MNTRVRLIGTLLAVAILVPALVLAQGQARLSKHDLADRVFTLASDNSLVKGGLSEKYLFYDDAGSLWIFKPMPEYLAYVEEAAGRLARCCGVRTPEVFSVVVNGRIVGSLSRIIKVQGSLGGRSPESLTQEQLAQLQELQVFRWWLVDFDTHANNFLVDDAGNVVTIDHGFAFSDGGDYTQKDLDSPNPYREYSYYSRLFQAYVQGKIQLDPKRPFALVDAIGRIPDQVVIDIIRPYARLKREAKGYVLKGPQGEVLYRTEDEFVFGILQRRRNLREGFDKFYRRLAQARGLDACPAPAAGSLTTDVDLSAGAMPIHAEPQPIKFVDDYNTFARLKRFGRRTSGVLERLASTDPHLAMHALKWVFAGGVRRLSYIVARELAEGLSIADVANLDLATLSLDEAFAQRLSKTSPAVLRLVREKAEFAIHYAESASQAEKPRKLLAMVQQALASQECPASTPQGVPR